MRVGALTYDNYVPADIIVKFLDRDFLPNRGIGAPRCGGALEMSISCCMCEPMETAQSLGDDSHAVVTRPKWAWEHRLQRVCGPLCRGVVCLAHRSVLEQGRAEVHARPRPLVWTKVQMCILFLYRNYFWDKNNFIKTQFHTKPRSSKTTFIKNHSHPKPCSPEDIFIQKHFTKKHFHPKHFHPNSIPVCWRVVWWVGMSGGAGWVRLVRGLVPVAGGSPSARFRPQFFFFSRPKRLVSVEVLGTDFGTQRLSIRRCSIRKFSISEISSSIFFFPPYVSSRLTFWGQVLAHRGSPSGGSPSGGSPSARFRPQFFCFPPKCLVSVGVLESSSGTQCSPSGGSPSGGSPSARFRPQFFFLPPKCRVSVGVLGHTEALHQRFSIRRFSISKISSPIFFFSLNVAPTFRFCVSCEFYTSGAAYKFCFCTKNFCVRSEFVRCLLVWSVGRLVSWLKDSCSFHHWSGVKCFCPWFDDGLPCHVDLSIHILPSLIWWRVFPSLICSLDFLSPGPADQVFVTNSFRHWFDDEFSRHFGAQACSCAFRSASNECRWQPANRDTEKEAIAAIPVRGCCHGHHCHPTCAELAVIARRSFLRYCARWWGLLFFIVCNGVWTWRRMGRCCVSSRTVRLACGQTNLISLRYARDLTSGFRHTPLTPSARPGTDTLSCCNFPHSWVFQDAAFLDVECVWFEQSVTTRLNCPLRWARVSVGNGSGTSPWSDPSD